MTAPVLSSWSECGFGHFTSFGQWTLANSTSRGLCTGDCPFCSTESYNNHHVYNKPRLTCYMMREIWSSLQLALHQPPDIQARSPNKTSWLANHQTCEWGYPAPAKMTKTIRTLQTAQRTVRNHFKHYIFRVLFSTAKELIQMGYELTIKICVYVSILKDFHQFN